MDLRWLRVFWRREWTHHRTTLSNGRIVGVRLNCWWTVGERISPVPNFAMSFRLASTHVTQSLTVTGWLRVFGFDRKPYCSYSGRHRRQQSNDDAVANAARCHLCPKVVCRGANGATFMGSCMHCRPAAWLSLASTLRHPAESPVGQCS